uniref:Uncharacterized protein n=1 Tax=Tanacetum cinerariifolium TaxID=118510 RepID=A0A6L2P6U2_TANCI|nr:hypothetical protein [Tanacetum cinerariifolium]
MVDVQVQQEIPTIHQTPLLDVLILVNPTMTTPTPSTTPPTTEAQATTVSATDPSPTVLLRLSELEKKVEALSKVDHSDVIEESVQANNPPNLLKSSTSSTSIDSSMKYELKNMLYNKMQKSGLFHTHDKHLDPYNALIGSIALDEAIAKGEIDAKKFLKMRHLIHNRVKIQMLMLDLNRLGLMIWKKLQKTQSNLMIWWALALTSQTSLSIVSKKTK